ncbi:MAG: DNRLRE domain-containing protein [Melioribacteraceae bacterium]
MIRFLRLSLFAVALTVILISCNQDPTSVGSNLVSEQDQFTFNQLDSYQSDIPQKSSWSQVTPKLGTSQYILLGKTSYAESSLLLLYNIYVPDSLLTRLKAGELLVKSASMKMIPRYTLGDKSAPFDFSIFQVRSPWTEIGFNRDSLSQLSYDQSDIKSNLTMTDTTLNFNLSTDAVKEWLMRKADSTAAPKNYGIIFKTKPSTQKILGFLGIIGTSSSNESILNIILERPSTGYKDTINVSPYEDVHVVTGSLPTASSDFYLEGGYMLKSNLFFDVTSLPKNSIVNKAILDLTVDESQSLDGSLKSDSMYVQLLADSTTMKLTSDSSYSVLLVRTGNVFSGDISWIVQKWLSGVANQGMILSLVDEYTTAARIAFYGSKDPNKALRPKLKITYMQKK